MYLARPQFVPSPYDPLGFGRLVEILVDNDVSHGEAFFDIDNESELPCLALFLDSSQALLLQRLRPQSQNFVRIGVAKFLRTHSQRAALPMNAENIIERIIPYGPIGPQHPKAIVTVI